MFANCSRHEQLAGEHSRHPFIPWMKTALNIWRSTCDSELNMTRAISAAGSNTRYGSPYPLDSDWVRCSNSLLTHKTSPGENFSIMTNIIALCRSQDLCPESYIPRTAPNLKPRNGKPPACGERVISNAVNVPLPPFQLLNRHYDSVTCDCSHQTRCNARGRLSR